MLRGVTSTAATAAPKMPFPLLPGKAAGSTQPRGSGRIQPANRNLPAQSGPQPANTNGPEGLCDGTSFDAIVSELVMPEAVHPTSPAGLQTQASTPTDPRPVGIQLPTNLPQVMESSTDRPETVSETPVSTTTVTTRQPDTPRRTGMGLAEQFKREVHGDDGNRVAKIPSAFPVAPITGQPEQANLRFALTPSDAPLAVPTRADSGLVAPQLHPEPLTVPVALHVQIQFGAKDQSHETLPADAAVPNQTESIHVAPAPPTTSKAEVAATLDASHPALAVIQQHAGQDPGEKTKNSDDDAGETIPLAVRPKNSDRPPSKDEIGAEAEHPLQRRHAGEIHHAPQSQTDSSAINNVEQSPTATPAIRSQSHLAVPAEPAIPRPERQTPQAAEKPVESAAPAPPETKETSSQPLRSVSLEFTPDGLSDVRLRLSERSGEVHISVHSNDPSMHGKLQDGIHDLIGTLSNAGYDANAWTPGQSRENHQRQREATPNPRRKDTPGAGAEDFGGLLNTTTQEGA